MAALTIAAADVGTGKGARVPEREVGEAVAHAEVIYRDTANNDHRLADATTGAKAKAAGIAVTSAGADGESVLAISAGDLRVGTVLTVGTEYYLGATPGTIVPRADLATGNYITRLGIARTTSILELAIDATGVQVP